MGASTCDKHRFHVLETDFDFFAVGGCEIEHHGLTAETLQLDLISLNPELLLRVRLGRRRDVCDPRSASLPVK